MCKNKGYFFASRFVLGTGSGCLRGRYHDNGIPRDRGSINRCS